jgi:hypothetical protein
MDIVYVQVSYHWSIIDIYVFRAGGSVFPYTAEGDCCKYGGRQMHLFFQITELKVEKRCSSQGGDMGLKGCEEQLVFRMLEL